MSQLDETHELSEEEYDIELDNDEELAVFLEKNCMIPFDVQCSYSDSILTYGPLGEGEHIGKFAQCLVKQKFEEFDENGESILSVDIHRIVGYIVGHKNDRIVIDLDDAYLGWLTPDEYQIVNVYETTPYIN